MTRLSEIKARLEKATPGPWVKDGSGQGALARAKASLVIVAVRHRLSAAANDANMDLIANSKSDLTYTISRIERLEAALKFYNDAWGYNATGYGIEWRPSDKLLDDCGNIASSALQTEGEE